MTGSEGDLRVALEYFRVVVLADERSVEEGVPVAGNQATVARDAREAVEMVHVGLRAHHELTGGNTLSARRTRAA